MWIPRDISQRLNQPSGYYIQCIIGPRQCGKSSLLAYLSGEQYQEVSLDDLQLRTLANTDPALFLAQYTLPLVIDEVQYAPNLFPALKQWVDNAKKQSLFSQQPIAAQVVFRLTGSNQILMDKKVKEHLVGRAAYYSLNTLSFHELRQAFPTLSPAEVMYKGGWPELYTNPQLSAVQYLNDYIRSYIEKDIVLSAGITKQQQFHTVLGMLAARTGQLLNYADIAKDSGVSAVTVREWVSILQRTDLVYLLLPYASNLNTRLIKSPKIYFLDTGLATRLQGWRESTPLLQSPLAGHLFETLVLAEIVKYKYNFAKDWQLFLWRTREGEEVDFIIEKPDGEAIAIEVKLGIHGVRAIHLSSQILKNIPKLKQSIVVSLGGAQKMLSQNCMQVPIEKLTELLHSF